MTAAAFSLALSHPYLGAAIWAIPRIPCLGLGTVAVDEKWRLYYDPLIVERWTVPEVTGVLYHEILHLLRNHADRGRITNEPRRWNLAADAEINDDLLGERITLPGTPVVPAQFKQRDNLTAEEYYLAIKSEEEAASGTKGSPASTEPANPRCGSGATGIDEPWFLDGISIVSDTSGANPVHPGLSPASARITRQQVANQILSAQKTVGSVPGHLRFWANDLAEPKVDWRHELASLVRHALADAMGACDYRYRRPSRRQSACPDIILLALRQPVPTVAVVVDTSGSMWAHDLSVALAEVDGILKATGTTRQCTVLSVDAQVQACRRVFRADQVVAKGGGGTDMGRGIEGAGRLVPRPEVVIILTDGYTPWPPNPPPGMRVVIGVISRGGQLPNTPTWARTVAITG
jgi:predicted metal-dependent peptidase